LGAKLTVGVAAIEQAAAQLFRKCTATCNADARRRLIRGWR
jgi:hypothetical protein